MIVISPIEETPAFDAGIQSQDVITQIDGQSTEGMDINEAVNLIRGRVGTDVVLTIRRGERELEFNITRARIEIHPVRHSRKDDLPGGVGYIRLTQFSQLAADEMRTAIQELEAEGIEGFILDLRSNPGGLLQASIEIARMWFDEGDIVSTVNRQGVAEVQRANGRALTDKPLVVLIDGVQPVPVKFSQVLCGITIAPSWWERQALGKDWCSRFVPWVMVAAWR